MANCKEKKMLDTRKLFCGLNLMEKQKETPK